MKGWFAIRYLNKSSAVEAHVIPACDIIAHTIPMCWCKPVRTSKDRAQYAHNAMDGRP